MRLRSTCQSVLFHKMCNPVDSQVESAKPILVATMMHRFTAAAGHPMDLQAVHFRLHRVNSRD